MAAYMMKPMVAGASRTEVAGDLHALAGEPAAPLGDAGGSGRVLCRLDPLIPLLPTGFIPPDDNSQTRFILNWRRPRQFADTKAAAEQARQLGDDSAACEVGLHHHRRRRGWHRSVCAAGLAEVRKATLDDPAHRAFVATRAQAAD